MEQNGGLFMDLQDTPFFKQRVEELEGSAKKLRERCSGLLGAARKYRDALENMQEAQQAFGGALADFGGGADEDSLLLGSAVMSQFIKTFKELAEFYRHLSTQLTAQLIDRLQADWVEGALAALREDHKRYDKRCADHEAARLKHLALRKLAKRDVVERSFSDLAAARQGADEARYDLGRRLTEVETAKRHAFLEMVVGTVFAHTKFFEQGHLSLGRLNGATNDALAIVEHLRKEQAARLASLEETIRTHKEAAAARDALIAQEVAAAAEGNSGSTCLSAAVTTSSNGAPGVGGAAGGMAAGLPLGVSLGGPVQMSAHHAALSAEVERLIQLTQHSNSQQVTIIKQGYLAKKSQGSKRGDWKRRFFVLDSTGMMYYYSHKADTLMQIGRGLSRPKNTLPLLTSTVKLDGDDPAMRFCFRVVSPEGTYTLQAESDYERSEWITALQAVISCLLNSSMDVAAMPRIPIKPTHSRHNSESDIWGTTSGRPSASGSSSMASPMAGAGPGSGSGLGSGPGGLPTIDGSDKEYDSGSSREGSYTSGASPSPPTYSGYMRGSLNHPGPSPLSRTDGPSPTAAMAAASSSSLQQSSGAAAAAPAVSGPAAAARALAAAAGSHSVILESLRKIPGNLVCADCGAPDPDWASVNLGVLLCIECSGIHRQLGVHISKVRSCTLDVKVWDGVTMDVFEGLGNTRSNRVWEAKLTPAAGGRRSTGSSAAAAAAAGTGAGGGGGDTWVLCGAEDVEVEGPSSSGRGSGAAAGSGVRSSTAQAGTSSSSSRQAASSRPAAAAAAAIDEADPHKPLPTDNLGVKLRYVLDKYAGRLWVVALPAAQAQAGLWDAVQTHDLGRALEMIAAGADVNQAYRTPRAQKLVKDTHVASLRADPAAAEAAAAEDQSPRGCGDVTVLHAAAAEGWPPMVEFLLQNGAQWQHKDAYGRTPLHYALLHNAMATAKQLLRRGGELAGMRDARGNTALDLMLQRGRVSDEELLVLVSGS